MPAFDIENSDYFYSLLQAEEIIEQEETATVEGNSLSNVVVQVRVVPKKTSHDMWIPPTPV